MRSPMPAGVFCLVPIVWLALGIEDQQRARIDKLVSQLGSARFGEREAACEALKDIGNPALGRLRRASMGTKDLEVRRRACELVEILENQLENLFVEYRAFDLPLP